MSSHWQKGSDREKRYLEKMWREMCASVVIPLQPGDNRVIPLQSGTIVRYCHFGRKKVRVYPPVNECHCDDGSYAEMADTGTVDSDMNTTEVFATGHTNGGEFSKYIYDDLEQY